MNGAQGIGHITQDKETSQLRLGPRECGVGHIDDAGAGFLLVPDVTAEALSLHLQYGAII